MKQNVKHIAIILVLVFLALGCSATTKKPYQKKNKNKGPCDCPDMRKNRRSVSQNYICPAATNHLFWATSSNG
jgi:PBP1b-binding outer membrane lipoprotein LpoB